jgi:PAS domain S-box-containing protein
VSSFPPINPPGGSRAPGSNSPGFRPGQLSGNSPIRPRLTGYRPSAYSAAVAGFLYHMLQPPVKRPAWVRFSVVAASLVLAFGLRAYLEPWLRWQSPFSLLLPAVLVSAWYGGIRAGLIATAIGGIGTVYVFMVPPHFVLNEVSDAVAFLLFLMEGIVLSFLCEVLHRAVNRTQSSVAEAAHKFEVMANSAPVLIWSTDASGHCIFANRTWLAFTGHPGREQLAEAWITHIHPDDRAMHRRTFAEALGQHRSYQCEYRLRHADGSYRWLLEHAIPRRDADGRFEGFIGSCTDITASRREREDLDFVARLQRNLGASLDLQRVASALAGAAVPALADHFCLELAPEHGPLELLWPAPGTDADPSAVLASLLPAHAVLETGETRFAPRAEAVPLLASGADPARRQALEALGLVSHLAVPLFARGRIIGILTLATGRSGRVLGAEELALGQKIAGFAGFAIDNARLHQHTVRALADTDRAYADLAAARELLRGHADVLEAKVHERTATLRELNAELEAFTYSVSHDLRTPLQFIRRYAEAVGHDPASDLSPDSRAHLNRIISAAVRMDVIIHDLLGYSRLGRGEVALSAHSLDEAVAEAVAQQQAVTQRLGAQILVDSPLPWVLADEAGLFQILSNLISNALKFTAPGRTPVIRVRAEPRERFVRLWIIDNGIGIQERHHAKIFQLFERVPDTTAYPGTGLGLALVRKAIGRMGGSCGLESAPGAGSRFWVDFPAATMTTPSPGPGMAPTLLPASRLAGTEASGSNRMQG